jgi:hypothetical protein
MRGLGYDVAVRTMWSVAVRGRIGRVTIAAPLLRFTFVTLTWAPAFAFLRSAVDPVVATLYLSKPHAHLRMLPQYCNCSIQDKRLRFECCVATGGIRRFSSHFIPRTRTLEPSTFATGSSLSRGDDGQCPRWDS